MPANSSKVVLITGASSGLGAAAAQACAAAGHRVVLAARRMDRLQQVADAIGRSENVLLIPTDIRSLESIQAMVRIAEERFGQIDVLVANAGVGKWEPLHDSNEDTLLWQMDVNVLGVVRCAREVLPGMLQRKSGHIITVASVAGEIPSAGTSIYSATKAAVIGFSEGLRREVEASGVRVTCIQPGFIQSEMTEGNPFPMPPASVVGDLVVRLIRRPVRRAVVPRWYGAGIWLNRFLPAWIDLIAWSMHQRIADHAKERGASES